MATAVQKITLSSSRDIPFNKLVLSQSNVRRVKAGVSIEELAEDIARALGTCGHVTALRRPSVEPFDREPMQTLESIALACERGEMPGILPADWPLKHLPAGHLDAGQAGGAHLAGLRVDEGDPTADLSCLLEPARRRAVLKGGRFVYVNPDVFP